MAPYLTALNYFSWTFNRARVDCCLKPGYPVPLIVYPWTVVASLSELCQYFILIVSEWQMQTFIADRLSSRGVRSAGRHSSDSHWDMVSPVGSPSCSSPYPSSSHLSSCSSDPSLPTTNLLSSHISSSSGAYLERRRGSVQLPTPSSRLPVNFLSAKRRFNRTYDSSTEDDGIDGNSRKKQRLRPINMSQIDGT